MACLTKSVITTDLRMMINSIGRDAGFSDWAAMREWAAQSHDQADEDRMMSRMPPTR